MALREAKRRLLQQVARNEARDIVGALVYPAVIFVTVSGFAVWLWRGEHSQTADQITMLHLPDTLRERLGALAFAFDDLLLVEMVRVTALVCGFLLGVLVVMALASG